MMDFSRNHMTSFRMRCALTILILALAEFSMEAGSAKPMLVQVWCGGDDGLTLRLRDAVENAFKASSAFALSSGKRPGTLIVTITQMSYGSRWERELRCSTPWSSYL